MTKSDPRRERWTERRLLHEAGISVSATHVTPRLDRPLTVLGVPAKPAEVALFKDQGGRHWLLWDLVPFNARGVSIGDWVSKIGHVADLGDALSSFIGLANEKRPERFKRFVEGHGVPGLCACGASLYDGHRLRLLVSSPAGGGPMAQWQERQRKAALVSCELPVDVREALTRQSARYAVSVAAIRDWSRRARALVLLASHAWLTSRGRREAAREIPFCGRQVAPHELATIAALDDSARDRVSEAPRAIDLWSALTVLASAWPRHAGVSLGVGFVPAATTLDHLKGRIGLSSAATNEQRERMYDEAAGSGARMAATWTTTQNDLLGFLAVALALAVAHEERTTVCACCSQAFVPDRRRRSLRTFCWDPSCRAAYARERKALSRARKRETSSLS